MSGATAEAHRSAWAGAAAGAAVMAAVDTIVFHQILGWHHFYDRSTPDNALRRRRWLRRRSIKTP